MSENGEARPIDYPYPGLRPFEEEEAPIFFGRGRQVDEMLKCLEGNRFLAVTGASGSGKSSLVRAGLFPALREGSLIGSNRRWLVITMKPGDDPYFNLAQGIHDALKRDLPESEAHSRLREVGFTAATLRASSRGLTVVLQQAGVPQNIEVLLLADQFEEIFRYEELHGEDWSGRDASAAFIDLLMESARQIERPRLQVVLTMRSDFIGNCDAFLGFPELISASQFLTPRLGHDQIRAAILGPLHHCGGEAESELVRAVLRDIGSAHDQLPLMQHALMRCWWRACERCAETEKVVVKEGDYQAVGGLAKALSNHANEALAELSEPQVRIAEMMFRSLVEPGKEQRFTRRPVSIADLAGVCGCKKDVGHEIVDEEARQAAEDAARKAAEDEVRQVVKVFAKHPRHFLVQRQPGELIDISHEALIRQWDKLRDWLGTEGESAHRLQRLSENAKLWEEGKAALIVPPELDLATKWRREQQPTANWASRYVPNFKKTLAFLDESHRQWNRRRLAIVGGLALAFVVAVGLAIGGFALANKAEKNAKDAKKNAVEAKKSEDLANKLASKFEAKAISEKIARMKATEAEEKARENEERAIELQQESTKYLGERDRFSWLWEQAVEVVRETGDPALLEKLAKRTGEDLGTIEKPVERKRLLAALYSGNQSSVWDVAVSPDLQWVGSAGDDKSVRVWDLAGLLQFEANASSSKGGAISVCFTPDSKQILAGSAGERLPVFDVSDGEETIRLTFHTDAVMDIEASADGKFMATASADGTVALWPFVPEISKKNVPDPAALEIRDQNVNRLAPVSRISFNKKGTHFVISAENRLMQVRESVGGRLVKSVDGRAVTRDCRFAPSDDLIVAGGAGTKVIVLNVSKDWEPFFLEEGSAGAEHLGGVTSVAFSSDGEVLASVGTDGRCLLWSIASVYQFPPGDAGNHPKFLAKLDTAIRGRLLKVLWHGDHLFLGGEDGQVEGWNMADLSKPRSDLMIAAHSGPVRGMHLLRGTGQLLSWSASISGQIPDAKGEAIIPSKALAGNPPDPAIKLWNLDVARSQFRWRGMWNFEFEGKDRTYRGSMEVKVAAADSTVSGTFSADNVLSGRITGRISHDGRTLEGSWSNTVGEEETQSGRFRFEIEDGADAFTGNYSMKDDPVDPESKKNLWTGKRSPQGGAVSNLDLQALVNTKIGIYIEEGDQASEEEALEVSAALSESVPASTTVEIYRRAPKYFREMLRAEGNEVRWDADNEEQQALAIAAILNRKGLRMGNFTTRKVYNLNGDPTYGFLSIFFAP